MKERDCRCVRLRTLSTQGGSRAPHAPFELRDDGECVQFRNWVAKQGRVPCTLRIARNGNGLEPGPSGGIPLRPGAMTRLIQACVYRIAADNAAQGGSLPGRRPQAGRGLQDARPRPTSRNVGVTSYRPWSSNRYQALETQEEVELCGPLLHCLNGPRLSMWRLGDFA